MPISLQALATGIKTDKTSLFLGAGASIASGGPTGPGLASLLWKKLATDEEPSNDLMEVCSILENRLGRRPLAEAVRDILAPLRPAGGTLTIPNLKWRSLYTTNFDPLIERAYARSGVQLTTVRSNYEYASAERADAVLFKIHGDISQDESFGDKGRMILTERDYEEHKQYREAIFARLAADLFGGDVIFVGYSLR